MNKKALLVFHPDKDKSLSINNLPPLGILYIASYLEKHGVDADVIETFAAPLKMENLKPYDLIGFSINISNQKCPFGCIFCSHAMGKKWRSRSAENVVEEIKWQVNEPGVKEICVYDDNFSLDKARIDTICDRLIEEEVPIILQFTNGLRVDCPDFESLEKLKKAGTWLIGTASETGNPQVMKKIKKSMNHEQVLQIRKHCTKLGIKTSGFFMIGFPFETGENILETIDYAKQLDTEIVEFNKVIPYANTELFEMMVEDGSLIAGSIFDARSYHEGTITMH